MAAITAESSTAFKVSCQAWFNLFGTESWSNTLPHLQGSLKQILLIFKLVFALICLVRILPNLNTFSSSLEKASLKLLICVIINKLYQKSQKEEDGWKIWSGWDQQSKGGESESGTQGRTWSKRKTKSKKHHLKTCNPSAVLLLV